MCRVRDRADGVAYQLATGQSSQSGLRDDGPLSGHELACCGSATDLADDPQTLASRCNPPRERDAGGPETRALEGGESQHHLAHAMGW